MHMSQKSYCLDHASGYRFLQTISWLSLGCEVLFVPYTTVKPRVPGPSAPVGVYADLDARVRRDHQRRQAVAGDEQLPALNPH